MARLLFIERLLVWKSGIILSLFCHAAIAFSQDPNLDSLKKLLDHQRGVPRVNTLNVLASAEGFLGMDASLQYAQEAFQLAQELNDRKSIITSEYELGLLYTWKKSDSLAIKHLKHAMTLAQEDGDPGLIAVGHLRLARYYQETRDYAACIDYANQATNIAEEYDLKEQLAEAHARLGAAYRLLGNYKNSLDHCFKALKLFENLRDTKNIARMFNDIGTVYQRTDDHDDALDYFNRAMAINETRHDAKAVATNVLNIGVIYQKKHNYEEALRYYRKALPLAREQGDRLREAIVTGNIGSTLVDQGKVAEGLVYLNEALTLKEEVNVPRSILHTLNDIADAKIKLGDFRGARTAAERVIATALQYHESDQLRYGYLNASKSYRLAKDFERAYYLLEKYNAVNDSLFNIEKAQEMRELEVQYDTEKKDMMINSLQQEKQIANAQRKIYVLIAAIVLLLLVALYIHQRLKTKRNQQLLAKEREVDRLKSDFFANISHEFRTPLSLILGPIETLLSRINDPDNKFQLELMRKSASRLLRLINQILDLSKLQHGRMQLQVSEFNVVERIKGVSATFQSLLESKNIQLNFKSSDEHINLFADGEQIETVFINLIGNAIKFTDPGGKIIVQLTKINPSAEHTDGEVELQVIDNGIGIPKDQVDHIFDRFYRAGSASEKQYGGTGIGLALTKELVELHKGNIKVFSELSVGTTVTIRLPLGKAHLGESQILPSDAPTLASQQTYVPEIISSDLVLTDNAPDDDFTPGEESTAQKPLILVIEDNADVRKYIRSILDTDYSLLQAVHGEEGVKLARTHIPDLIISDVMMPRMNGYEACKCLKQDEKTSHIPVILLTAKASIDSRIEGLETEADLYLNKPFVPRELFLYVNNLIQSRRKLRERYNRQVVLKPSDIAINSMDELFLQRLMKVVEANFEDENFSVEQLSADMGMSRSQLHRKLHALTNESCSQFIRTFRLQRAMELLKKRSGSISEIAFKVGFSSPSYFNKCFAQQYGCTPSSVIDGVAESAKTE